MKAPRWFMAGIVCWAFLLCLPYPAMAQTGTTPNTAENRDHDDGFPWVRQGGGDTVASRFQPPDGFARIAQAPNSFGHWLRRLPLLPGRPKVKLFNGRLKGNQRAQIAVLDLDVGHRDLQQCADAVIRLRAEYLWAVGRRSEIAFRFTSGDPAAWPEWERGMRPAVQGQRVRWRKKTSHNSSYANFRKYLDTVFIYAGSASLEGELNKVPKPSAVLPGDVFIQGGYPGHAVIVLEVVENDRGKRLFLLGQSYMPAQQVHVLRAPGQTHSPWYEAKDGGSLVTPEWLFNFSDLHRFED